MRELVDYWRTEYDWRRHERTINSFTNVRTHVDGVGLHVVHERGWRPDPLPLVLTHGWPSSFLEMAKITGATSKC